MTTEQKDAADAIRESIKDKPRKAYAAVKAFDVVTLAASIPVDKRTPTIDALAKGAAAANEKNDPDLEVYQIAGQLAGLVEAAG